MENEALKFAKWLAKNQWHPVDDKQWERWYDETESIEQLFRLFRFEYDELIKNKEVEDKEIVKLATKPIK